MRVKRYLVDSMPDALSQIRSDLGKDAVILNTKEIKQGGFLGFFGKRKIEVIAAVDSSAPTPVTNASRSAATSVLVPPVSAPVKEPQAAPQLVAAAVAPVNEPNPATVAAAFATVQRAAEAYQRPEPAKAAPPVDSTVSAAPAAQAAGTSAAILDQSTLLNELKHMKDMMTRLTAAHSLEPIHLAWEQVKQRLLLHGVEYRLIEKMLSEQLAALDLDALPLDWDEEACERLVRNWTVERLGKPSGIGKTTQVVHIVGPTGVGKTTTIAKLAAEQVLKLNRKIGLITSDTYRIAAVDQLRTYANILNVPLEVVFSPHELNKAFEALKDCELIFMDTAGRNYRNELYVSELNSLLRTRLNSETYLVLSLTTKYKDMKAITENFAKFNIDKVLFTKLDETDSYGSIVNLVHDFPLKLSFVTNGQDVPDDIELINPDRIIDLLLEGDTYE